jgi:hypothetical protein
MPCAGARANAPDRRGDGGNTNRSSSVRVSPLVTRAVAAIAFHSIISEPGLTPAKAGGNPEPEVPHGTAARDFAAHSRSSIRIAGLP